MSESSTGLNENLVGMLCYVGLVFTGLFFFLTEKKSKYVRFHGLQSTLFFVAWVIVWMAFGSIFSFLPVVADWLLRLVKVAGLVGWVLLIVKSYKGEYFLLPVVGRIAMENSEFKAPEGQEKKD